MHLRAQFIFGLHEARSQALISIWIAFGQTVILPRSKRKLLFLRALIRRVESYLACQTDSVASELSAEIYGKSAAVWQWKNIKAKLAARWNLQNLADCNTGICSCLILIKSTSDEEIKFRFNGSDCA